MLKKIVSLLTALCLLGTLAACGGKEAATAPTTTAPSATTSTTAGNAADTDDPLEPALNPTFAAMPQKTQDFVELYRLSDTVVLAAFITPGMDASATQLVSYDLSSDTLLGEVDLGEGIISVYPEADAAFSVLDYTAKTVAFYDSACRKTATETIYFNGPVGEAVKNGDRLLLSDMMSGTYVVYSLANGAQTAVDASVSAASVTPVAAYKDGWLLSGYGSGLVYVNAAGETAVIHSAAIDLQAVAATYAAGVVGDYAVFYPLAGGETVMTPVRGEAEQFASADGNGLLSTAGNAAHYYDMSRRTVATYTADKTVAAASLRGTSAVVALREDYGQPLTFAYVEFASLSAESMNAAAYDQAVIDDLRPLPAVSGVAAEIKETYGVTVIGDVEFFDLSVFGYTAVPATADQIADRLDDVEDVLAFFPEGIFKEIGQKTPVVLVLCEGLGNNAGGINTILDGYAVSYVSVTGNDAFFENVTAHELAHAVERQMSNALLDGWISMQPVEVQAAYGDLNLTVEYTADHKGETPTWFITVYGRSEPIEDRATVFAAMYDAYAEGDSAPLNYDGLKQKVAYWSRMLRATYACCADAVFAWDSLID